MKTNFYFFVAALVLSGCNKQTAVLPAPEPKPIQWEYKVVLDHIPSVVEAVVRAKTDLAEAERNHAEATANRKVAAGEISQAEVEGAKKDAGADFELKKVRIEIEQEDGIRTNLLQSITNQSTNSWELVSANIAPEHPDKMILIFKRPAQ